MMADLTEKVAGDKIELHTLVPAQTEPHDWEPSTTDMVKLEQADLLILNGAGMESWSDQIIDSLNNPNLTVVTASDGIQLLEQDGHADPHVWLSPQNAKQEMENIKNALVELDPANQAFYQANYSSYAEQFDQLDQTFHQQLDNLTTVSYTHLICVINE